MSFAITRTWRFPAGLLLALLALACQIAVGSLVLPADSAAAELDAATVLCQAAAPGAPQPATPHHHHAPDCAICPFCAALALPGAILTPAPALPAPSLHRVAQTAFPPPARAPPSRSLRIAFPRGPPSLT